MTTRGIRNNNPGNIVADPKNKWQGLAEVQDDPRFCVFAEPKWGIRALAVILIAYQDRYNLNTVSSLIGKYAPPSENNTVAYVKDVATVMNVGIEDKLDLHKYETLRLMVEGIIRHENNIHANDPFPYDDETMDTALTLAGVTPPARMTPNKKVTTGTIMTGVGAITTLLSQLGDTVQQITPSLPMVSHILHMIPPWSVGAVLCVGVAVLVYERFKVFHRLGQ